MKKNITFIIALALIVAGVFYFYSLKERKTSKVFPLKEETFKKEETLKNLVERVLSRLEKDGLIRVKKGDDRIIVETKLTDIENVFNNTDIARENNIRATKAKDIVVFQKENETLTISLILEKEDSLLSRPMLSIVIDDIGNSKELGEELFKLKGLTYSIIPDLPYSKYFADLAKEKGKDIMLHIPMEPKDADKYGKTDDLLKVSMSDEEIIKKTEKFISSVPNIRGVNNHMGSKFTESDDKMRVFLKELKRKDLFFLDSRTSGDSKGYSLAKDMGIISFKRDIFLDHEIDEGKIKEQLDRAVSEAVKNGFAIAIGHPHKETIKVLKENLPEVEKKVKIVPLSKAVIPSVTSSNIRP